MEFCIIIFKHSYFISTFGRVKQSACQCRRCKRHRFDPWVGKIPWSRKWRPTPVFLPGESHGQRSLMGYSPAGHIELDMTEHTYTHSIFPLYFINKHRDSCSWVTNTETHKTSVQFSSVQSLSRVQLFATPWTAAHQASLSITNFWSLLKLMSIESVMPSNHLIFCRPLLFLPSVFPGIRVFSNELVLHIRGQSIGVSASASVLPMNIQDWFPLGWTGWSSLLSKGLSRLFSNTTVQKHQFFSARLSL